MKKIIPVISVALAACVLLVALIVLRPKPQQNNASAIDPYTPQVEILVSDFVLTDRFAAPVSSDLLDGRYTVLDFFFTSCPLYCPVMTASMRRVQNEIESPNLRLMSISIDGANDTPLVIGRYADGFGVDPERWLFATGPAEAVWPVIEDMGFLVAPDRETTVTTPGGGSMDMLNHPTRLLLIGPDRRVIGWYRYNDPIEIDALIARLTDLLD